eukprot:scaffold77278_cov36-Tisochrysis_lutea.AAC.1
MLKRLSFDHASPDVVGDVALRVDVTSVEFRGCAPPVGFFERCAHLVELVAFGGSFEWWGMS